MLGNDSFAPDVGETLSVTAVTQPANGTVTLVGGVVSYTPDANFFGTDTFTYTISDGNGGTDTATVTVTVDPANDNPDAVNDAVTVGEDSGATVIAVLGNDSFAPDVGETLSVTAVTQPANGTVTLVGGVVSYTPDANFFGTDTFTYTISDGNGGTDTATVTVTVDPVNDPPVAVDDIVPVTEDTPVSGNVLGNDTDVENDPLTVTTFTVGGSTYPAGTTVNLASGDLMIAGNGTYTFTPAPNYTGPVPVATYTVSDGNGGTDTGNLILGPVSPVNDPPVAIDDVFAVTEDTPRSGNVLPNDIEVDGDTLNVVDGDANPLNGISPVSGPSHGTLVLTAAGTFTYTPDANYNGTDSFVYRISDGNGGFSEATVTLNVVPANDAPVAGPASITTPEDQPISGSLPAATDADGDLVTYSKASNPSHGTVTVNPNGTYVYVPDRDFHGADTFTYSVTDGNGELNTYTVTVMVTPVNDPPVATNDVLNIEPDRPGVVRVLLNDTDVDGDPLTVTSAQSPNGSVSILADGSIRFVPAPGFSGATTVTYVVSDGRGGFATATVMVTVEEPPFIAIDTPDVDEPEPVTEFTSITADGMVVDTVRSFGGLGSVAGSIGEGGIIVQTVNAVRPLGSVSSLAPYVGNGIIGPLDPSRIWDINQRLESLGYDRLTGSWDVQGLTGFSLRMSLLDSGDSAGGDQIVIESLVRDRLLMVHIGNTLTGAEKTVVQYRILQANGAPLPDWLERAGPDMLLGEHPADVASVKLRVNVLYSDGSFETKDVEIQTKTGEIQPYKANDAARAVPFESQFADVRDLPQAEIESLATFLDAAE